jgi:hypothetical protein
MASDLPDELKMIRVSPVERAPYQLLESALLCGILWPRQQAAQDRSLGLRERPSSKPHE